MTTCYYISNLIFLACHNVKTRQIFVLHNISVMMSLTTRMEVAHVGLEKDRRKECPVSRTVLRFRYSDQCRQSMNETAMNLEEGRRKLEALFYIVITD